MPPCEEAPLALDPAPYVRCPCKGCHGHLRYNTLNAERTLLFLTCEDCQHACIVKTEAAA